MSVASQQAEEPFKITLKNEGIRLNWTENK